MAASERTGQVAGRHPRKLPRESASPLGKTSKTGLFAHFRASDLPFPSKMPQFARIWRRKPWRKSNEEATEETADGSRRAKEGGGRGTGGIAAGVNAIRRQQRGRCGGLWGRPSSRPAVAQTLLNDGRIASRPVNYLPCLAARSSRAIQAKMRAGERRDMSFARVFGNSARVQAPQPLIRARFR